VRQVVRGIAPGDSGYVGLDDLKASMELKYNGVRGRLCLRRLPVSVLTRIQGSPWKLYVDPAQDVICYHNFTTGQQVMHRVYAGCIKMCGAQVLEHNMTDDVLVRIARDDYVGSKVYQAKARRRGSAFRITISRCIASPHARRRAGIAGRKESGGLDARSTGVLRHTSAAPV
jgi:hypothetical protein